MTERNFVLRPWSIGESGAALGIASPAARNDTGLRSARNDKKLRGAGAGQLSLRAKSEGQMSFLATGMGAMSLRAAGEAIPTVSRRTPLHPRQPKPISPQRFSSFERSP